MRQRLPPRHGRAGSEKKPEQDADDHEARFGLAQARAGRGDLDGAAEALLDIIARDPDWKEGAARAELLKLFEAAGPASDLARNGRRQLSALLFS